MLEYKDPHKHVVFDIVVSFNKRLLIYFSVASKIYFIDNKIYVLQILFNISTYFISAVYKNKFSYLPKYGFTYVFITSWFIFFKLLNKHRKTYLSEFQ